MGNSIRIQLSWCPLCPRSLGVLSNQTSVQTEVGAKRSTCLDVAGWKLEFGLWYKVCWIVLGYDALREGKIVCVQAPDREVYTRDTVVFPLADVAEKDLDSWPLFWSLNRWSISPISTSNSVCRRFTWNERKVQESVYHFWYDPKARCSFHTKPHSRMHCSAWRSLWF